MRSRNRKINNVGAVGCLGLLALGLALVNPVTSSVYAYDSAPGDGEETGGGSGSSGTVSSVQFTFGEPVGVAELTPVSSSGASAKYSVKATVSVKNSGGYAVYLGSSKSELIGKNTGTTINPVTSSSSYGDLPSNTWGYNAVEGETTGDSFSAMPTNNRGNIIGGNTSNNIKSDEKTFTLSFATHIGNDKPADTYENEVTMSVVSSPMEVVANDFGIATMQEMTSAVCNAATDADDDGQISAQLEDVRDGKYYWVSKLADGKCWMTQNLDLDLSTSVALTPSDSDVASNWTPGFTTATEATEDTVNADSQIETRSWSLGDYYIKNPTVDFSCGGGKINIADCPEQTEVYTTPVFANGDEKAHYIIGNYYQWNAATAGTGGSITSGQATGSICPKGWKLPESNVTTAGSFGGLLSVYSIVDGQDASMVALSSPPLYFVKGGIVYQSGSGLSHVGNLNRTWSSTPLSDGEHAYYLNFESKNVIRPSDGNSMGRQNGYSIRCVAR